MDSTTVVIRTVKKISEEMNIPYQEVNLIVDTLFRSTKEKMKLADMPKILWKGFGTFMVKLGTLDREIERLKKNNIDDPELVERYRNIIKRRESEEIRRSKRLQHYTKVRAERGGQPGDKLEPKNNGKKGPGRFPKG